MQTEWILLSCRQRCMQSRTIFAPRSAHSEKSLDNLTASCRNLRHWPAITACLLRSASREQKAAVMEAQVVQAGIQKSIPSRISASMSTTSSDVIVGCPTFQSSFLTGILSVSANFQASNKQATTLTSVLPSSTDGDGLATFLSNSLSQMAIPKKRVCLERILSFSLSSKNRETWAARSEELDAVWSLAAGRRVLHIEYQYKNL